MIKVLLQLAATSITAALMLYGMVFYIPKALGVGVEDTEGRQTVRQFERNASAVETESQVLCSAVSSVLVAANADRIKLIFKNISATSVYICYATACTAAAGMLFTQDEGYTEENYTGEVSCITASGTATVAIKDF